MDTVSRLQRIAMVIVTLFVSGCAPAAPPAQQTGPSVTGTPADAHGHTHTGEGDHSHGAGPHGGTLADWGGGAYHVEFTVDHDKQEATIYILGSDERTPAPINAAGGKLLLTIKEPSFQVDLVAQPFEGESAGTASRFAGRHEQLGTVREFAGTISGEVDGTPYAADFREVHAEHAHE